MAVVDDLPDHLNRVGIRLYRVLLVVVIPPAEALVLLLIGDIREPDVLAIRDNPRGVVLGVPSMNEMNDPPRHVEARYHHLPLSVLSVMVSQTASSNCTCPGFAALSTLRCAARRFSFGKPRAFQDPPLAIALQPTSACFS